MILHYSAHYLPIRLLLYGQRWRQIIIFCFNFVFFFLCVFPTRFNAGCVSNLQFWHKDYVVRLCWTLHLNAFFVDCVSVVCALSVDRGQVFDRTVGGSHVLLFVLTADCFVVCFQGVEYGARVKLLLSDTT